MNRRDNYRGDVIYEVWRRGGNPDAVDYDDIDEYYDDGLYPDEAASREICRQTSRQTKTGTDIERG